MTTMTPEKLEAMLGAPERRDLACTDFELRQDGDTLTLDGYASVFNKPYPIYGGPDKGGFNEIVDPEAFDRTLREKPDLHLLVNHEGLPLARTKSDTLTLSTDKKGLRVEARLDRRDPDVQRLEVKMQRGDMDEMSFAFRTIRHEVNEERTERRLLEVSLHKGDVSVVNFGANPNTSVKLRSFDQAIAALLDSTYEDALVEARSMADADRLADAISFLTKLRRDTLPAEKRTLSVAEARALLDA